MLGGGFRGSTDETASFIQTHTIVMRSSSLTVREIKAKHQDMDKF